MPPAGYPAFLQYLQSGRVSTSNRVGEVLAFGDGEGQRLLGIDVATGLGDLETRQNPGIGLNP